MAAEGSDEYSSVIDALTGSSPLATVFIADPHVTLRMSEDNPERTSEEQEVLEQIAESRGEEFVEENDELILAQARLIGDL